MRFYNYLFIFLGIFLTSSSSSAQILTIKQLETETTKQNDALKYDVSIQLLTDFISQNDRSPYEKYRAYIYKSDTYKRVFNYEQALQNLNLALQEGLKSNAKFEVENRIKAEKAFVYFDTHQYAVALKLMDELRENNYKYLSVEQKTLIIMQEGFLFFLDKNYAEAEKRLDVALNLALKYMPRNAPNIYGKKIEVYNAMRLFDKRDEAFALGMRYAKEYKIIKYEMYLYEMITSQYKKSNDYKNAFLSQQKFDSLSLVYNSINNSARIQNLEKQIDDSRKQVELKNERYRTYFLLIMSCTLAILLFVSIRLFLINKQKRILVENENIRIRNDIAQFTKVLDDKGNKRLDISAYNITGRQKEIIALIQEGKSNKEIATELYISENTVKYHLKIIYGVLDIGHRSEIK